MTATVHRRGDSETATVVERNDSCLLPIVAVNGKVVGLITDPDVWAAGVGERGFDSNQEATRVFRCKSNQDLQAALKTILNTSRVEVEVCGGHSASPLELVIGWLY